MTGYGRGECLSHDRRFKVEVKSVNHRYGDISIKLPRFLNPFEDAVRKRLAKDIQRGKADVFIHFETFTERDIRVTVNAAFADAYEHALRDLSSRYILPDGVTLSMLAAHPDIINVEKDSMDDATRIELWDTLSTALEQALLRFNAMREAEGGALKRDLLEKREKIRALLSKIAERAPAVTEEYAARLRERVAETLAQVGLAPDEGRLLTEIAVFADRSCIDEEITRLGSHIGQMGEILAAEGETVGRKLDFLVQELNREANTIGSKSSDAALTKLVVELKSEVEKIREQVQNIE
jgi:uncharacterized protein (TIGR00255 family)